MCIRDSPCRNAALRGTRFWVLLLSAQPCTVDTGSSDCILHVRIPIEHGKASAYGFCGHMPDRISVVSYSIQHLLLVRPSCGPVVIVNNGQVIPPSRQPSRSLPTMLIPWALAMGSPLANVLRAHSMATQAGCRGHGGSE